MNRFLFLNFVFLQIYTNRSKHFAIFILATLLIALLSAFLFLSKSIAKDIKTTIDTHPDFVLQKVIAGKVVDTPTIWLDEIIAINGVTEAQNRVYGQYFYEPAEHYFTIVGLDFYDEQIIQNLQKVVDDIDIDKFLKQKNMIIGSGVKSFLEKYHFFDYYTFRPPNKTIEKVYIYDVFGKDNSIVSADIIIMDISLAKKIFGMQEETCTDIVFNIPNSDEVETIKNKIKSSHGFDIRIISKEDFKKAYDGFFNYKSSLFLLLYLLVLVTFILIIYQRYSYINSVDKKEIAILRSLGWSITQVIWLKIVENIIIFVTAFLFGINLAYLYLFVFDAPILSGIFLGFSNVPLSVSFTPNIDFGSLILVFLFFIVPIIASILIPVWKIAITEPTEAMR